MISFLERGRDNLLQLAPLYEYSYARYGTTFSKKDKQLKETREERLKRKKREELENYLEKIEKENQNIEDKFEKTEDKIKYFLQKAKDSGVDSDNDAGGLSVE
jgi:predicted nuclease with TOPRIM domain